MRTTRPSPERGLVPLVRPPSLAARRQAEQPARLDVLLHAAPSRVGLSPLDGAPPLRVSPSQSALDLLAGAPSPSAPSSALAPLAGGTSSPLRGSPGQRVSSKTVMSPHMRSHANRPGLPQATRSTPPWRDRSLATDSRRTSSATSTESFVSTEGRRRRKRTTPTRTPSASPPSSRRVVDDRSPRTPRKAPTPKFRTRKPAEAGRGGAALAAASPYRAPDSQFESVANGGERFAAFGRIGTAAALANGSSLVGLVLSTEAKPGRAGALEEAVARGPPVPASMQLSPAHARAAPPPESPTSSAVSPSNVATGLGALSQEAQRFDVDMFSLSVAVMRVQGAYRVHKACAEARRRAVEKVNREGGMLALSNTQQGQSGWYQQGSAVFYLLHVGDGEWHQIMGPLPELAARQFLARSAVSDVMVAAPGTEAGESGLYVEADGSLSRWLVEESGEWIEDRLLLPRAEEVEVIRRRSVQILSGPPDELI